MITEIIPIALQQVDWNRYLTVAKQMLGRSISTQLDAAGMTPDNLASFLVSLNNIKNPDIKANDFLKEPGEILSHGHLTFMVLCTDESYLQILEGTKLSVTSSDAKIKGFKVLIVSGTLNVWRDAVLNGCSISATTELRVFADKIYLLMEKLNLSRLWLNYQKRTLTFDNTFILEGPKK